MPPIEIFEGKSITWILLISLIICIWYLAKFTRDFVSKTVERFQTQMEAQQARAETREAKLMEQIEKSNQTNALFAKTIEKFEQRFDKIDNTLSTIREGVK